MSFAKLDVCLKGSRHACGSVTNWQSLLYCARAEVTVERIRSLAAEIGTEPLTVDFKQSWTPRIAECAAAMANTYGGLIIVGITNKEREFVGVSREAIAHVVDGLAAQLGRCRAGRPTRSR